MIDTYGDCIPEQDGGVRNTLPEPPASVQRLSAEFGNAIPLWRWNQSDLAVPAVRQHPWSQEVDRR